MERIYSLCICLPMYAFGCVLASLCFLFIVFWQDKSNWETEEDSNHKVTADQREEENGVTLSPDVKEDQNGNSVLDKIGLVP